MSSQQDDHIQVEYFTAYCIGLRFEVTQRHIREICVSIKMYEQESASDLQINLVRRLQCTHALELTIRVHNVMYV